MKCVAIDDEPLALNLIREYAARMSALQLVAVFDDAIAGAEFLRNHKVDLLFIDINMPDITGLDLVKSLVHKPLVVFTTAYKKFAIDSYELEAVDYLLKPIEFERFQRATNKAFDFQKLQTLAENNKTGSHLFVRSEYNLVKIELDEVEYIESLEDYLKIHFANRKPVMTLMTLKSMLEKLPASFMRIHRSYIVSLSKIKTIANRKVKLTTAELPVSETYNDVLVKWMHDHS